VGPDLFALFLGAGGRAGTITSAHLRGRGPSAARPSATRIERDPGVGEAEAAWIARALATTGSVR
jgi:alkyldihydroxyacetonephosphate synthase